VYGHPEVLGGMAEAVLPALCALADELRLPRVTLGDYADFWMRREALVPSVHVDVAGGRLTVDVAKSDIPVRVTSACPLDVVVNGVDVGRIRSGTVVTA